MWTDFLGAEVRWIDAGGVPTRVVSAGADGATVVLLHGRGGHLESWRANFGPLAERVRVIAFDLLGHGLTGDHDGDYAVGDLVSHAERALDALRVADAVLVGQSLGGWVSVHIALRRTDLVRALALIEPAGLQSEEERLADPRVAAAYARGGRAFSEPTADAVRERLTGLVADPAVIDDELVQTRLALYAPAAARAVHRRVRAADNRAWLLRREVLQRLSIPVLLVRGEQATTPADVVERAGAAAGAWLETVPGTRQWPQLERPALVNDLLLDLATT